MTDYETDKDFSGIVDDFGNVIMIQAWDIPDEAEAIWNDFKLFLESKRASDIAATLNEIRINNWGFKSHEATIKAQKDHTRKVIKAITAAGNSLHELTENGLVCYAEAVKQVKVNPSPDALAEQLLATAKAMQNGLDNAPADGSRQNKPSVDRAINLRHGFYKAMAPLTWEMKHLNLFLVACGERSVSEKTVRDDINNMEI